MDQDPRRAPTLRDVARLVGVHPATASRALSGARTVNPDLVRRIRKAAESLDYQVNPVGRALKQRTTGVIGMVVPDLTNPFFPALVRSVERSLAAEARALFLCDSDDDVAIEQVRVQALMSRQVDGLIISPVHATGSRPALAAAAARLPVVQVDRMVQGLATDVVVADQAQMTAELISHLRERGSRSFCLITADEQISPVAERDRAYRQLVPDQKSRDDILRGGLTAAWGAAACHQLLDRPGALPDAIVCINDLVAVGVLGVLRSRGVGVPDQVRVAGFDNTPLAAAISPQLTTVQQPIDQIGDDALNMLTLRSRDLDGPVRRLTLAGTLIVRSST